MQPRHCAISKFLHENSRGASSPRSCDAGRVTGGAATIPAFVIAEAHARQNLFSACHVREKERPERERWQKKGDLLIRFARAQANARGKNNQKSMVAREFNPRRESGGPVENVSEFAASMCGWMRDGGQISRIRG